MIEETISSIVEQSKKAIKIKPGDYQGDGSRYLYDVHGEKAVDGHGEYITDKGLWYCGKCHGLKQYPFYYSDRNHHGRMFVPNTLCKCEAEAEQHADALVRGRAKDIMIHRNLSQADRLMLKNTFANDKHPISSISKISREYVNKWRVKNLPQNIGLYLYGGVGVGKTFYASCIANDIARVYGDTVKAISITTALNELRSANDPSGYISDLTSYDLLILDDFGAERQTDYINEQLYTITDERYKAQKPLIITSNYPVSQLKKSVDVRIQRIADRIIDMCLPIEVKGTSQRGIQNRLGIQPTG